MSFWMSLLLYNFAESWSLVWCCHVLDKRTRHTKFTIDKNFKNSKFEKFRWLYNLWYFWFLGFINLIAQYIPSAINNQTYQFIFMMISSFVVMPLIIYFYTKGRYKAYTYFASVFITLFAVILASNLFQIVLGYNVRSLYDEFIHNVVIRLLFVAIILFLKYWRNIYEKYIKKNFEK